MAVYVLYTCIYKHIKTILLDVSYACKLHLTFKSTNKTFFVYSSQSSSWWLDGQERDMYIVY